MSQTITVPPPYSPLGITPSNLGIVHRMIFGRHGEPSLAEFVGRSLRHRPGLERATHFKTEIVMKMAGRMFLNDEQFFAPCRLERGHSEPVQAFS